ncbi:putative resolvase [Escherichia coli]|nr:putative resolvase [Escherichia coli]SPW64316.1 putative resolvase [Escherichia coli]
MSGSVIHSQSAARVPAVYSAGQSPQLPVVIDYPAALALRQMSMVHDELPKYLLAPEVSALLHYVPDLRRKMLLATLWNTGARINEALALTRGGFFARASVSVCAAGHSEAADRKSRQDGRKNACRTADSPAGSALRLLVRQSAADDGGNTENSSGTA